VSAKYSPNLCQAKRVEHLSVEVSELRHRAGELVRHAQAGGIVTVNVDGHSAAQLEPTGGRQWRRVGCLSAFSGGLPIDDAQWRADLAIFDGSPIDPG
jgi:antitoxin (DNA-binding transcriptional repressor) of toxin-antitoxin stability system